MNTEKPTCPTEEQHGNPVPATPATERELPYGPFAVMADAPWNVLDSRGCRIALCGGDSNADWERHGPAIAKAIVEALNRPLAPVAEVEATIAELRREVGKLEHGDNVWQEYVVRLEKTGFEIAAERDQLRQQLAAANERAEQLTEYDEELTRCEKELERWPLASGCNGHLCVAWHIRKILDAVEQLTAERDGLLKELLAAWKEADDERMTEQDKWDAEAVKWRSENDWCGYNFHKGMAAGANWVSIFFDRIRRKLAALTEKTKPPTGEKPEDLGHSDCSICEAARLEIPAGTFGP